MRGIVLGGLEKGAMKLNVEKKLIYSAAFLYSLLVCALVVWMLGHC